MTIDVETNKWSKVGADEYNKTSVEKKNHVCWSSQQERSPNTTELLRQSWLHLLI